MSGGMSSKDCRVGMISVEEASRIFAEKFNVSQIEDTVPLFFFFAELEQMSSLCVLSRTPCG